MDLTLGFLFRDGVALLNFAGQPLQLAFHVLQVVMSVLSPTLLHFAFELLPVSSDFIPVLDLLLTY